jgi:putative DNA primase/helicase
MTSNLSTSLLDSALAYATHGWAVHPLHTMHTGTCSCGQSSCPNPGKHPRTQHGVKDATTDEATIRQWWERHPDANIGIATGTISNLVVLDVDPRHGGDESLKQWTTQYGQDFLATVTSCTGGGGLHLLYTYPDQPIRNKAGLAPGLDIRGDSGYIVAPPSMHASGQPYHWEQPPDTTPLAPLPAWLLDLLTTSSHRSNGALPEVSAPIPEGQRNNTLTSLAGTMRRRGMSAEEICGALLIINNRRCQPPLQDDELWRIATSIARYGPSAPVTHGNGSQRSHEHAPESDYVTDYGNARRLVKRHGLDLRFCPLWGQWFVWNGTHWVRDLDGEVMRRAKETVVSIYTEVNAVKDNSEQCKALLRHAQGSQAEPRLKAMIKLAESEREIPVLPDQLDTNPWLLNVRNGTLDLRTGTLRAHRRDDLITKVAPVAYDPDAACPVWQAFLARIMRGNEVVISFLQRVIGYALTGSIAEQCFFLLYGTGANGKSTFLETVRALLGAYAHQTDFTTFLVRSSDTVRNDLARLRGSRFVSAVEVESGRRLDEALVKQVTGGDPIVARFLYREFFQYVPQFKIFLAANHKPVIRGTDDGIWRRIRLIPFTETIPPQEQDKDLLAKLRAELPGILKWALAGCLAWQREGLGAPEEIDHATETYRDEMDPVGAFLEDCCDLDPTAKTSTHCLYTAFTAWCQDSGESVMHLKRFAMRLAERGFTKVRMGNRRGWVGLKLQSDPWKELKASYRNQSER